MSIDDLHVITRGYHTTIALSRNQKKQSLSPDIKPTLDNLARLVEKLIRNMVDGVSIVIIQFNFLKNCYIVKN